MSTRFSTQSISLGLVTTNPAGHAILLDGHGRTTIECGVVEMTGPVTPPTVADRIAGWLGMDPEANRSASDWILAIVGAFAIAGDL